MKIILSPAKALNFEQQLCTNQFTQASFIKQANFLAEELKQLSINELRGLMKLSESLAELNYNRYQQWQSPTQPGEWIKPAIALFNGAAYKGLDAPSLSLADIEFAQNNLRVLSGLYGILRPLDLMYPYRLEMGTRWKIDSSTANLYQFWNTQLADFLNNEMEKEEILVNLASTEYFKAIDLNTINAEIITPVFKESKNDTLKVVMMYAKTARGKMARWIIQQRITAKEALKSYEVDGYSYQEELSSATEWVFVR